MNIRDLQYLVAVYDLKNFSKAAERCFVSQPTLSGQLKKLEEQLGMQLMERSTRHVLFTDAGEQVVAKARQILLIVDEINDLARQSEDPMAGDFHLGFIPTVGPFLLPLIMPELARQYPQMTVYLYELRTDDLLDKLHHGELDAAVLAKLDWSQPLLEIPLYQEMMLLAVHEDDPLAARSKAVSRAVLEGRSVLMLEDGHCLRGQALGVCFSAGAREDDRFQATSMDTLLHMVATGTGMTLIPRLAAIPKSGVRYLEFSKPQPSRDIVLVARPTSARLQALHQVAELIENTVSSG